MLALLSGKPALRWRFIVGVTNEMGQQRDATVQRRKARRAISGEGRKRTSARGPVITMLFNY